MAGSSRPKKIVAVDWDARSLRVVHALLGKRGVKIDKLLSVAIPPELDQADPKQMGRHLGARWIRRGSRRVTPSPTYRAIRRS